MSSAGRGSVRLQLSCLAKQTRHLILVVAVPLALPKAAATPSSVDWRSLPRLMQEIGADALPVTSAANLLVGVIIGFLGVSQLGRFGAVAYVPELGGRRALPGARTAGHRDRRGRAIGRWSRLGDRHDEGVGGNRRLAVHGVRPGEVVGRATLSRTRRHGAALDLGGRRAGPRRRSGGHGRSSRT